MGNLSFRDFSEKMRQLLSLKNLIFMFLSLDFQTNSANPISSAQAALHAHREIRGLSPYVVAKSSEFETTKSPENAIQIPTEHFVLILVTIGLFSGGIIFFCLNLSQIFP